jgi:hypothetical protein
VAESPGDDALRTKAARALAAEGRYAESARLVAERWRNLTAHQSGQAACACAARACNPRWARSPRTGSRSSREFAVAGGRVLWFWWPEGMEARRAAGVAAVTAQLAARFDAGSADDEEDEDA